LKKLKKKLKNKVAKKDYMFLLGLLRNCFHSYFFGKLTRRCNVTPIFQGLKIIFQCLKIIFQGLKIIFQGLKIILGKIS